MNFIRGAVLRGAVLRACVAVAVLAGSSICMNPQSARAVITATPNVFYVNAAVPVSGDGSTWGTAWKSFDKIDWTQVKPGAVINVAAGIYGKPLVIGADGEFGKPIRIVAVSEVGTNQGQVLISGFYSYDYKPGIQIGDHKYVTIEGKPLVYYSRQSKSIRVANFRDSGVELGPNSDYVTLKHIEVDENGRNVWVNGVSTPVGSGIKVGGRWNTLDALMVHNNGAANIDITAMHGGYSPTISRCWIHNVGGVNRLSDGVRVNDGYRGGFSWFRISRSVLGPALQNGVVFSQRNGGLSMSDCLMINPNKVGIVKTHTTMPDSYYSLISLSRITSFMPPKNYQNLPHSQMKMTIGQDSIYNSVFWGGTVDVTGTRSLGSFNTQFKTSGNTLVISAAQVDPLFNANVGVLYGGEFTKQINTDYSLSASSPAAGKGSSITSVSQLLQMR